MNESFRITMLAAVTLLVLAPAAMAQSADGQQPDSPEAPAGGRHHGRGQHQGASAPDAGTALDLPKPVVQPRQRLDAGALFCGTEDQLRAHQAAIKARLAGQQAGEPGGCHFVPEMVAVTVVSRDGPAATQVQVPGSPPHTGWTDSLVRDAP